MKRKVKRPFDNEQFRKGYVAGIFAAEKELNTELLHFAEKAHKIMSEGTFPDYGVKINFKDSNNTITTNLNMKTEEKAKKYDEALEWMREVYPTLTGAAKEDAEHYFPELKESKESKDERIRKAIVELVKRTPSSMFDADTEFNWIGASHDEILAYLEKQKEQKPVTINQDEKEFLADEITAFLCNYDKEFDGEDPVPSEVAEHFYLLGKQAQEQKSTEWSEEDKETIDLTIAVLKENLPNVYFKTNPANTLNMGAINTDQLINRLKSLKDRGNFPKSNTNSPSEWSEEDKKMLLSIIKAFRIGALSTIGQEQWLKLLPDRFNLQPSLEHLQKEKVYDIIAKLTNLSYSRLIPFNSEEYKKINEIISNVFDLLKYSVEKK